MISFCLHIFRDNECIFPSRSVGFSNNKATFGPENKRLLRKCLVLELKSFHFRLRNS